MKLEDVTNETWHECGSIQFQWDRLYDMQWEDPQLENMRVAAAQYGGPIATIRDSRKMILIRGGMAQPIVRIFNCAGIERAHFIWNGGTIVGMGWTVDEKLLLVDIGGEVAVFDIHGRRLPVEFSLGTACMQEKLVNCVVYPAGVVGLTFTNSIWVITDLTDVRPHRLAEIDPPNNPQCMSVRLSEAHGVEVVLACEETIWIVDSQQAFSQELDFGLITQMSIAPNNELIMIYTQNETLVVLSRDLAPILSFESPTDSPPLQIAWCSNDLIVMAFEDVLIIVEPDAEWTSFTIDGPLQMLAEIDGLRIFTNQHHYLLRKVSQSVLNVLSTESDHPGRDLYLARQAFDAQDAKADMILRNMKDQLQDALHACIEAASDQIDVLKQRDILKAATFGIAFCPGFPNLKLYETCQRLRILNYIREPQVGITMTMSQLKKQSIETLISRLINAYHHLLASKICESMGMNQDEVLRHWACARIFADGSTTDDEDLKSIIVDKLVGCKGVKYATIAEHAQEKGRMNLARLLLEYEVIAADQVPLLLKLGDEPRALRCAIESGDTDLVYYTIFHLYRKMALSDNLENFYDVVFTEKEATDLFLKYCKAKNPDMAKEMYRLKGSLEGEAAMCFDMALDVGLRVPEDPLGEDAIVVGNMREQTVNLLREAAVLYVKPKKYDFQAKICEDFAQLRKMQAHVDQTTGRNVLVGLSVVDSIKQCIRLKNQKAADDFKRSFGVSEKHFWWIKVQTLAEIGDWDALEVFANSKKSPIGWEPFIKASMSHGAPPDRVEKLIDRLPDSEEKVDFYARVGLNHAAARTANNLQNVDLLTKIQGMMGGTHSQFGMRTATMIDRLKGQGGSSSGA